MDQLTNGAPTDLSDEDIDRVSGLLLGITNDLSESRALLIRQAVSMLRFFKLTRQKQALTQTFDPMLLERVPAEVLAAERTLTRWFAEKNIREWKLGGVQSRTSGVEGPELLVMQCSKCCGTGEHEGGVCRRCLGVGTYAEEPDEATHGVRACGKCFGTGKDEGANCRRCLGTGQDKHDPWCVGGEQDGICNCGADGAGGTDGR